LDQAAGATPAVIIAAFFFLCHAIELAHPVSLIIRKWLEKITEKEVCRMITRKFSVIWAAINFAGSSYHLVEAERTD